MANGYVDLVFHINMLMWGCFECSVVKVFFSCWLFLCTYGIACMHVVRVDAKEQNVVKYV